MGLVTLYSRSIFFRGGITMSSQDVTPDESQQPDPKLVIQQIASVAAQQIRNGQPRYAVIKMLTERGVPQQFATQVVDQLFAVRREALKKRAERDMLIGGLFCVGGVILTILTYSSASSSPSGGTYILAWGPIIFGAVQFFRGLSNRG
jgi:hypothetical protein